MSLKRGSIQQRGVSSFRIRYYDANGWKQEETIKGTLEDAQRELQIRLGEVAAGVPVSSKANTVRFEELAADVVNDYIVNGLSSKDDIEARFRLHLNPVFGKRKAAQITTAQIKAYIIRRQGQKAKAGTINRELEALRRAFNLAMSGRKVLVKPHIPMLREANVRAGFFTRPEVDRLCSFLKPPLDSFVLFGFLTGWRYSEIQNLRWSNVDFERGEIRIDVGADKNRAGRVFYMTAELRGLLEGLKPAAVTTKSKARQTAFSVNTVNESGMATLTPFVFHIGRKPIGAFRKSWRNACFKAGLPCIVSKETGKPIKALRLFHDLRRSGVREMVAAGLNEGEIMKLVGHKSRSMFDRYNIISEAQLRSAVEKLNVANSVAKKRSGNSGTQ